MTRRRVLMGLLLVVVVAAALRSPGPARADSLPGYETPSCITGWTAFSMPYVASVSVVTIRFHLYAATNSGRPVTVEGRWETAEWNGTATYWNVPGNQASAQWFATDTDFPALRLTLGAGYSPGGWLRYGMRVVSDAGCFSLDSVVVTRYNGSGEGAPATPTPGPGGSPSPTPGTSSGPSASPTMGWCSVYDGTTWRWVPCTAATPSPTPSPSPSASAAPSCLTVPVSGPGTWSVDFTTGADGWCMGVWLSSRPVDAITVAWNLTVAGLPDATCENQSGQACDKYRLWYQLAGGGGSAWTSGGTASSFTGGPTSVGAAGTQWQLNFCVAHVIWPYGYGGGPDATHPCASGAQVTGFVSGVRFYGTITIGTGAPTPTPSPTASPTAAPTPSPDASAVAWCGANPGSWLCSSAPPGWSTPPPSPPHGQEPWAPVEICQPGTLGADRLACATWPPQSAVGSPDIPPYDSPLDDAFGTLTDELGDHAPFSWAGEVAGALNPGSYAGSDIDWCFDVTFGGSSTHICMNPYTVTDPISNWRSTFAALLAVVVAWAVARRVWAVVGGTPGGSDA